MGDQATYSLSEAVESPLAGIRLQFFPKEAFDLVCAARASKHEKAELFAKLARFNALYMVARAGSGHLGSSFSSLEIVTWLYLNVLQPGDRYFSSKGHDSPGLYSVQAGMGIVPFDLVHKLRRLGGLPGHPDVRTPGSHANTGSLGMGVSKAKGFLFADDHFGRAGRVFVMTGDGELQEGQFWESLLTASRRKDNRLTVIVDHNKLQSDSRVASVSDLGDLEGKFAAFGWEVRRCDGHDFDALATVFEDSKGAARPVAIIADTVKGRGVSFMEHTAMATDQVYYAYHSGAPRPDEYSRAAEEILAGIRAAAERLSLDLPSTTELGFEPVKPPLAAERMIPSYTDAILACARANSDLVALDADLVLDTGLIPFREEFPDRFVECGIAEQDMVSQAGTMALAGLLPVVHSFACFLTSRASEQIYNNCTQGGRIVYVGSLAGVLPGGPGHSHQAVRDITAMSAMPGLTIVEPTCASQVAAAMRWATEENAGSTYLRLTSIPYEGRPEFEKVNAFVPGQGCVLHEGDDATLLTLGPVMTSEALKAADLLERQGIKVKVISTPWANRHDADWYRGALGAGAAPLLIVENHYVDGGFGSELARQLIANGVLGGRKVAFAGLSELPNCGANQEVLSSHRLDSVSLANRVETLLA